jgi:predicted GNAT family N-acyltransferase
MECRQVQHGSEEYRQTVELREKILRRPLGLSIDADELPAERASFHLACWAGDRLAACLVLEPLANGHIKMRQVAVDTDLQGRGIGAKLVAFSESFARRLGYSKIVMHAREAVVPFYERLGYTKEGEPFTEVTLVHFLMCKKL